MKGVARAGGLSLAAVVLLVAGGMGPWPLHATHAFLSSAQLSGGNVLAASASFGGCQDARDDFGYECLEVPYEFLDVSANGTSLSLGDNEYSGTVELGFDFDFYGEKRKRVRVSSNGFLKMLDQGGQDTGCCSGQKLHDPAAPNTVVAGYWEDLDPSGGGSIRHRTVGSGDERAFVLQFTDVPHKGGGPKVTFQIVLYEDDHHIQVNWKSASSDGGNHSAGIENKDGSDGLSYQWGNFSRSERSVRFLHPDDD